MTEEQKEECRLEGEQKMILKIVQQHLEASQSDQDICNALFINLEKLQEIKKVLIHINDFERSLA
jgi:hypothetical protein